MPELWPEGTEWDDHNLTHATAHGISADEIDQVIDNGPVYRRNERGRSADYLAVGVTDGGRRVVVAVEWRAATRRIAPDNGVGGVRWQNRTRTSIQKT